MSIFFFVLVRFFFSITLFVGFGFGVSECFFKHSSMYAETIVMV